MYAAPGGLEYVVEFPFRVDGNHADSVPQLLVGTGGRHREYRLLPTATGPDDNVLVAVVAAAP